MEAILINEACICCLQKCIFSLTYPQLPLAFIKSLPPTSSTLQDDIYRIMKSMQPSTEFTTAVLQGPDGHFWVAESAFVDTKGDDEKETLLLVHIDDCHFTFRIFGADGCERTTSKFLSPKCSCCRETSLVVPPPLTNFSDTQEAQQSKEVSQQQKPSFSVFLSRFAVSRDFRVRIPRTFVKEWMPYKRKETLLIFNIDGKTTEWKVGFYVEKDTRCSFSKGWGKVVRAYKLKQWDKCLFVLVDKFVPSFEVTISRSPRD